MEFGLVLSGGGARGIAHLGVLKALQEEGLSPSFISGVSSGAITGTLFAAGMPPDDALEILLKTKLFRYLRPALNRFGLLNIEKLTSVFQQYFPVKTFEELKIKTIVSATDLEAGKTRYFEEGPIIPAILASSAIPVLFTPITIENKLYIDGGVLNNFPIDPLRDKCSYIMGVHTNPLNTHFKVGSIRSVLERTFQLAIANNVNGRLKECHLLIEPLELSQYSIFDISQAKDIYKIGYLHARRMIAEFRLIAGSN